MPADPVEVEAALAEGIKLVELARSVAFVGDGKPRASGM